MRALLAAAACLTVALSGCTGGGSANFLALAQAAPGLLELDMGPTGTLRAVDGTMTVTTTMDMQGDGNTVSMPMRITAHQEHYTDGAVHLREDMTGSVMGQDVAMTLHYVCTPESLRTWMEGMPGQQDGEPMDTRMENPMGSCSAMADMTGLDPQTGSLLQQMQGPFENLTFKTVERESGTDYAVYETTMEMGQGGMTMTMTMVNRATLDGGRIDHMEVSGRSDMSFDVGGRQASMRMEIAGSFDLTYGARGALPADLA